jgi:hypothetical protein
MEARRVIQMRDRSSEQSSIVDVPVRVAVGSLIALACIAALFTIAGAISAAPALAAACPNEAIRVEQGSTYLPECRAYEMVSPDGETPYLSQGGGGVTGARASSSGDAIAWFSLYPLVESYGGFQDLSFRGSKGWSTQSVTPPTSTDSEAEFHCAPAAFYSADLSKFIMSDGFGSDGLEDNQGVYCQSNEPALVEGEPEGFQNLFQRDTTTGSYRLVNVTPAGVTPANASFQGASEDFSHVFFEENAALTDNAPPGEDLYVWDNGTVHLVSVLPDGTAVPGAIVDSSSEKHTSHYKGPGPYLHSVSSDGTRVFFEAEGKLYVRIHPEAAQEAMRVNNGAECGAKACTLQIDASHESGPGGSGRFVEASTAGTKVFFTDGPGAKLTGDTRVGSGENLYLYETETGMLTDLTAAAQADVLGIVGASEDGNYLYFVAEGALATGATPDQPNLYLAHEGALTFIATLSSQDRFDWEQDYTLARVSPNGLYVGFQSVQNLTAYDSKGNDEVFRYSAAEAEGKLICVSCDPSGAAPVGSAEIQAGESAYEQPGPGYLSRSVLNHGQVFFNSPDPLVSSDVNATSDVYEYDDEAGVQLISSGTSTDVSRFYDAGENGEDVFFVTTQSLVGSDTDNAVSLYDARVDGGFAEPLETPPCSGEGCRTAMPQSAAFSAPGSASFGGSGNLAPLVVKQVVAKKGQRKLTRSQKLARALRACAHIRRKGTRQTCLRQARRKYGAKAASRRRGRSARRTTHVYWGGAK